VTRVFVDTSALMAFLDADDLRHDAVVHAFAGLADDELLTHGYVVAESLAVTRRRLGVDATISLIDDVLPTIEVLSVDAAMHAQALRRYRAALPTSVSFVDHVSLAVIERGAIGTVFALDLDLGASGLPLIPGEAMSDRGSGSEPSEVANGQAVTD
jgi:predicted nucleic acid-binding protein